MVSHGAGKSRCERDSECETGTGVCLTESAHLAMHGPELFSILLYKETVVVVERMQLVYQCRTLNQPN